MLNISVKHNTHSFDLTLLHLQCILGFWSSFSSYHKCYCISSDLCVVGYWTIFQTEKSFYGCIKPCYACLFVGLGQKLFPCSSPTINCSLEAHSFCRNWDFRGSEFWSFRGQSLTFLRGRQFMFVTYKYYSSLLVHFCPCLHPFLRQFTDDRFCNRCTRCFCFN